MLKGVLYKIYSSTGGLHSKKKRNILHSALCTLHSALCTLRFVVCSVEFNEPIGYYMLSLFAQLI